MDQAFAVHARGAVIQPVVERLLIANGIGSLPDTIETVSPAFGRKYTRTSDAVWAISTGVVADDIADGLLVALPVDTAETTGPVGLTMRVDTPPSLATQMLMQAVRDTAAAVDDHP